MNFKMIQRRTEIEVQMIYLGQVVHSTIVDRATEPDQARRECVDDFRAQMNLIADHFMSRTEVKS